VVARHAARQHLRTDSPGADEATLAAARRGVVLDAMRELPTRQREVLALRYYLELSEAEIAETLGISRGAVKSHASRGAAALRELLGDHWTDSREDRS
jgi:RNA polymerase sigma factor (sigma-70 family)